MIHLWDLDAPAAHDRQSLLRRRLIQSRQPRPLVLVCPGGGYGHLAPHEGKKNNDARNAMCRRILLKTMGGVNAQKAKG